ncbi:MAG TPA: hypothetical protein VGJ26_21525 [Pirellulales bacterium]
MVNLADTEVTPDGATQLQALPRLRHLTLNRRLEWIQAERIELRELRKCLPNCEITTP